MLRSMHRRCNYDKDMVNNALQVLMFYKATSPKVPEDACSKVTYYIEQYERSGMTDVVILPYLSTDNVGQLSHNHVESLLSIVEYMLSYEPFELVTIHDEFRSLPGNLNYVRQNYINILAELADSNLLDDLLSQLYHEPVHFEKGIENLSEFIRGSNYGLC